VGGAFVSSHDILGQLNTGWLLAKGVSLDDDFTYVSWAAAAGTVGAKWFAGVGSAAAATLVTPSAGGVAQISHGAIADSWYESQGAFWYLQDGPRLYIRHSMHVETVVASWTGLTTAWDAGAHKPYAAGAAGNCSMVGLDTSIGAFYYALGVRGGVVTAVSSTIAPAADTAHVWDVSWTTAGVMSYTLDGTARAGLTAAQQPVVTQAMSCMWGMVPLEVAAKIAYWDTIKLECSRNGRVTLI
jgi:hypothetical protein